MLWSEKREKQLRIIGVILAGGDSRRMGGQDKALVTLASKSLFGHVLEALTPQVDDVIISGASDYGSGLISVADIPGGAEGPVAGIRASYRWLESDTGPGTGNDIAIVTAPVDCPFLPGDLVSRLSAPGGAAIAVGDGRLQPTFGYWPMTVVATHIEALDQPGWMSLQRWAKLCDAETVPFGSTSAFFNINDHGDLAAAERKLAAKTSNTSVLVNRSMRNWGKTAVKLTKTGTKT